MQNGPALITLQKSLDSLPATGFSLFLQHQQRVIGGPLGIPAAVGVPRQTDKPVQKVITGIRI